MSIDADHGQGPRGERRTALRCALRAALAALAVLAPAGCATTSVVERTWLEVRTAHYTISSALPEADTLQLARDVEAFRRAVEFTVGATLPAASVPTRIVAFDGRTLERPFDVRGEPGYLIPRLRGDLLVLRTGRGWRGDAPLALRVRHARQLLRGLGAPTREWPPWVASGLAQLAGTVRARSDRAVVGAPHEDHVRLLRREPWVPLRHVLAAPDLRGWNDRQRLLFDAEAWALAHALRVDGARHAGAGPPAGGLPEAVDAVLGADPERALRRYVRRERFDSLDVRLEVAEPAPPGALPRSEVFVLLGELSVALRRPHQARDYFERALGEDPGSARAHAGLGAAETLAERWDAAREPLERAVQLAPGDARVWLELGAHHQAHATATADPTERARLAGAARRHLERSLQLDAALPEPHARLAALALLDGDPARALASLERARALRPGSPELELQLARVQRARGDAAAARAAATRVLTSSRSRETIRRARRLLETLEVARNRS